jgi:hypothetical protein
MIRWAGLIALMGEKESSYKGLIGQLKETDQWEDLVKGGRIILKCAFKKYDGENLDWIHLAKERDQLQAHVNIVVNHQIP